MAGQVAPNGGLEPRKICIIGAGLTGLGYLQAFLHLPEEARREWQIDVYESRDAPGGVWEPQPNPPVPPTIPETSAYDDLETIVLGPLMTFPGRPLPPSTSLFPKAEVVNTYIKDYIRDFGLPPYIHLRHTVKHAELAEGANAQTRYPWTVTFEKRDESGRTDIFVEQYSTIIGGRGITPTPRFLDMPGEQEWLAEGKGKREILHSMWYRRPDIAKDRFVVVVGNYPSGNHIAMALSQVSKEVHHVAAPHPFTDLLVYSKSPDYHLHPSNAASFTPHAIVMEDGTSVHTPPDALVILATGFYEDQPYFSPSLLKRVKGSEYDFDSPTLTSNERYIRLLYKCLLPIDPAIPCGSLAFGCLFTVIFNLPTSYAQGLWFGHLMADLDANGGTSAMVPNRQKALEEVRETEVSQGAMGMDMTKKAYFLLPPGKATDDISDHLIREARLHSKYPLPEYLEKDPNREYTEPWRRKGFSITLGLIRAWHAAKEEGIADDLSKGAETEEDFASAIDKLEQYSVEKIGPVKH